MSPGVLTPDRVREPVRPMDPRLRERRIEIARARGRRRLRGIGALALVAVLAGGSVAISRSSVLDVDAVTVTGAARSGHERVRDVAGIERGRAMTSVDLAAARARVEALPWVAAANVERRWPGTVRVGVREHRPLAVAGGPGHEVFVNQDGQILGRVGTRSRLPNAWTGPVAAPGGRLPPSRLPVLGALADLPATLRRQVARGTRSSEGLTLVLRDGIVVRLGDRTRPRAKAAAVEVVLAEAGRSTIATIDVAVPDAAAVTRRDRSPLTRARPGGA